MTFENWIEELRTLFPFGSEKINPVYWVGLYRMGYTPERAKAKVEEYVWTIV